MKLRNHAVRICAASVAFVDKCNARYIVAFHLLVHGNGLGLHTAYGTQHQDCTVENPKGSFDLDGEIDVSRGYR